MENEGPGMTIKLCKTCHVVLADKLTDTELDRLGIPGSDSGDYVHVDETYCENLDAHYPSNNE